MSKLQLLPNEILIQCFEYLDAINLFHSFDDLNFRFNCLIRQTSLHVRFEHVKKCALTSFCQKLSSDVQVTNRIKSLKISKRDKFSAVDYFLQSVSLNQLTELQALTFNGSDTEITKQILSALPLLTKLKYYGDTSFSTSEILASLPTPNIKTLSLKSLDSSVTHAFTSLVNLTVSYFSTEQLCACFTHSPMLQYVRIESLTNYGNSPPLADYHAVHLNRLIINSLQLTFNSLETLLQRTPNLKSLAIISSDIDELVDACRWQHLITTSLPYLNIFKFKFGISLKDENDTIVDKFLQFQTDYWHQQHHWFIEYVLTKNKGYIYTVPYLLNKYDITEYRKRYSNELNNNVQTFANVNDLTLNLNVMDYTVEYYFPNVKSLRLTNNDDDIYVSEETKQIEYLKRMINLNSITHLEISSKSQWNSPLMMLQILKEAVHLSSLKIGKEKLLELLKYPELYSYLTIMIRKLDIEIVGTRTIDHSETEKICQTFSNLEEFYCDVGQSDNLKMILVELSKLLHLTFFSYTTHYAESGCSWLEEHKAELDSLIFFVKCEYIGISYYPYDLCSCGSNCTSFDLEDSIWSSHRHGGCFNREDSIWSSHCHGGCFNREDSIWSSHCHGGCFNREDSIWSSHRHGGCFNPNI